MGYRDELRAAHQRVDHLERECAQLREKLDKNGESWPRTLAIVTLSLLIVVVSFTALFFAASSSRL